VCRVWYVIAAALVVAGLLGMVPLARARASGSAGTAAEASSAHSTTPRAATSARAAITSSPTAGAMGAPAARTRPARASRVLAPVGGILPHRLVRPRLVVDKTGRTLTVLSAGTVVKVYRIALGRRPDWDKVRQGDNRTPLGHFYVCNKNAQSNFNKALGLSYPNAEDARRGLAVGLITRRQELAILEAVEHGQQPPWNTKLGGQIMIHGGGTARDWTTGCVAMNDSDIDELFPLVPVGTPVVVEQGPPGI